MLRLLMMIFLLLQCLPACLPQASAQEKVVLQLKWHHAFQFAGYYAAVQQGYYRQAGLDVELREASPATNVLDEVTSGRAAFGVGNSSLLLARNEGKPVVALAVIFQHSPAVIITAHHNNIHTIHDLRNKQIQLEASSEELLAYLQQEHVPLTSLQTESHHFSVDDLMLGKTDAISAYLTSEPFLLEKAGFAYDIYSPRSIGIDFYGDNLFTTESQIRAHPERVKAFLQASLRGWEYALNHPQQIIELILQQYPNRSGAPNTNASLKFEADHTEQLVREDLVALGYMNPGRWQHIADTFKDLGMLENASVPTDFLYTAVPARISVWVYWAVGGALIFAVFTGSLAWYIYRINRQLEQSLAQKEKDELKLRLLSMAIEHSPTSVVITNADNQIEYVNPQFSRETGYSAAEAIGETPRILQSGLTETDIYREMWTHLRRGELWSGELINRRKNGEIYWEEAHIAPVFDARGKVSNYVGVKLDITERKLASDRLNHMAHHDSLTNLPNRTLFFARLAQGLELAKRNKVALALMYIDLDKFKPINDVYGHAIGDRILQEAAKRMVDCVRKADTVGRIGGDEFVGLMLDIGNTANAEHLAQKICSALTETIRIEGRDFHISASIGIALYPDHGSDETSLARCADIAMYHAKATGRDNVKVFDPMMSAHTRPEGHLQ